MAERVGGAGGGANRPAPVNGVTREMRITIILITSPEIKH